MHRKMSSRFACISFLRYIAYVKIVVTVTDPEFRNFFSQFGELQESVVMFDRETRRSRGFGFVTYVNPDISKSLLQIGGHGDGIGRLVMRGKTCEVKAAAPKGQAPTRGGRSNRGNRGGARNQCQGETHQVSTFRPNELYPVMYQNDSFNMQYPQGAFSSVSHGPGFAPPGYHPNMHPHSYALSHGPHHGSFPLIADHDPRVEGVVGAPYFIASAIVPPSTDRFSVLNAFPPTLQIPAYHQQQDHSFLPYGPGHFQPTLPATEMATMTQPVEQNIHATEEIDDNGEGVIAIEN